MFFMRGTKISEMLKKMGLFEIKVKAGDNSAFPPCNFMMAVLGIIHYSQRLSVNEYLLLKILQWTYVCLQNGHIIIWFEEEQLSCLSEVSVQKQPTFICEWMNTGVHLHIHTCCV